MREDQLNFLRDEFMEHMPGPTRSGKEDFLYQKQKQLVERMHGSVADWQPPDLPSLAGMKEVVLDLETTGLRWWAGDRLIGAGLRTPDGKTRYLPIRHKVGPNIPEEQFFRWIKTEMRDLRVLNIRTKFDAHMLREDGVDLDAQGCTFGDVAHYAALLDDHRRLFNQADLALAFLGESGKVTAAHGYELDPSKFAEYPAGLVAPRAEGDVETVFQLQQAMWPRLTAEDLHRVREIEDQTIPVVVEMEHNGCPLDVEMLDRWCQETERVVEEAMWDIKQGTGCDLSTPNNRTDIKRIFNALHLDHPLDPETKEPSIADDLLALYPHLMIQRLRCAIQVSSLRSKFLLKYQRSVARDGILRYELHQLPYQDDEGGHGGAVSGRFSSAAPSRDEGANLQQVFGVKTQQGSKDPVTGEYTGYTRNWLIKKLFKPDRRTHKDAVWLKADASQFQFRLFAHYANSPGIIQKYNEDRTADYHQVVHDLILEGFGKDLSRTHTKNVNFACVAPNTPVLKSDLTWVEAQTLNEGDELLTFDECKKSGIGRKGSRRWRLATVTGNVLDQRECARITLDNGDVLISTLDHQWVTSDSHTRGEWRRTDDLHIGDKLVKALDVWHEDISKDAGWLAGFMDGEGSATTTSHIVVNQNEGSLFNRCVDLLQKRDIDLRISGPGPGRTTAQVNVKGNTSDRLRLLGEVRPLRLITDFVTDLVTDRVFQARNYVRVISIENIGVQWISALGTSEATYIAAGYAAHNTIFGAGPRKMASQLGVPADQIPPYDMPLSSGGPMFHEVLKISETYHTMFPEVKPLLGLTGHLAMPTHKEGDHGCGRACREFYRQGYKHRGFVKTFLGRRARFGEADRHYSALNRIIQGTEGDVNKRVLIEVYKLRKELGLTMRVTVHDELDSDLHDPKDMAKVKAVLNTQYYDFRVPILWEVGVGDCWADAK